MKKLPVGSPYLISIVSAIILLASEKDNKTVRTHAWQSLIMGCFFIVVLIVLGIISGAVLWSFAFGLYTFLSILTWLVSVAWIALTIICIVKAVQGDIFKLPVIYDKAANLK